MLNNKRPLKLPFLWPVIGALLAIGWLMLGAQAPVQLLVSLPKTVTLYQGESLALPQGLRMTSGDSAVAAVAASHSETLGTTTLQTLSTGESQVQLSLWGIPLRTVTVDVKTGRELLPGGDAVGVGLYLRGVLVVGLAEIQLTDGTWHSPASDGGLKPGDEIRAVDGTAVESAHQFTALVTGKAGAEMVFSVRRGQQTLSLAVTPIKDPTGQYRLGAWVRDSTAGVGTLTYIDEAHDTFGALGHAINDPDTGIVLAVKNGTVVYARVLDIVKGESGNPGELQGDFSLQTKPVGALSINTDFGIFGEQTGTLPNGRSRLPIATQNAVKTGPATLLCTLDDTGTHAYDCQIRRVTRQGVAQTKSMVIEITDPVLLNRTGGIVQGMSGSPIIQDGRIIGAVTHVFINDPTKGYGVFIEWMLEQSDGIN